MKTTIRELKTALEDLKDGLITQNDLDIIIDNATIETVLAVLT